MENLDKCLSNSSGTMFKAKILPRIFFEPTARIFQLNGESISALPCPQIWKIKFALFLEEEKLITKNCFLLFTDIKREIIFYQHQSINVLEPNNKLFD